MTDIRGILGGVALAAGLALAPFSAGAITVSDEAVSAEVKDHTGATVASTVSGPNPALLILGPFPAEFNANISAADNGTTNGFTSVQGFVNNTGADLVLAFSTILIAADFDTPLFEVSTTSAVAGFSSVGSFSTSGALLTLTDTLSVSDGASFWIRASAADVISAGDFDYSIAAIPLPAGLLLLLSGLGGLALVGRRRTAVAA